MIHQKTPSRTQARRTNDIDCPNEPLIQDADDMLLSNGKTPTYNVRYSRTIHFLPMDSVSVNKFRETLKDCVEKVISQHSPMKVTRRNGEDFVVISAEDWEREQETLYILQNNSLMQQISDSLTTHMHGQGYSPTSGEIHEILNI